MAGNWQVNVLLFLGTSTASFVCLLRFMSVCCVRHVAGQFMQCTGVAALKDIVRGNPSKEVITSIADEGLPR